MSVVALGIRPNWRQFSLLILVNAFVGAMVGMERALLPLVAEEEFGIASRSAIMSFIFTFGLVKAATNLVGGPLADRYGRKRLLLIGWLFGLPVPFILMWAPAWSWVVGANVLLGVNQGLAWSMTVTMKIDLAGPARRGLAMGLNEFAGYLAAGLAALATGLVAEVFGLRPEPFYLGVGFAAAGLGLSSLLIRDTMPYVRHESDSVAESGAQSGIVLGRDILQAQRASWKSPALSSASQAGFFNNLNDGVAWGLFPLLFAAGGATLEQIGALAAAYPITWGVTQLGTGALSDRWGRRPLIVTGMFLQAVGLVFIAGAAAAAGWFLGSLLLGVGTALVYPTLLAAVADVTHPRSRGTAIGGYRLWRDLGYAAGAVVAGILADATGIANAILVTAALTAASGFYVALRMPETLPPRRA